MCECIVRMCLHLLFSRLILFSATRVVPVKAKGTFVFSKTSTFSEKKRKPVKAICSKNNATYIHNEVCLKLLVFILKTTILGGKQTVFGPLNIRTNGLKTEN